MDIDNDIFIPKGEIPAGTTMKVLNRTIFSIKSGIPELCILLDGPSLQSEVFNKYSNDSNVMKPKSERKASMHVEIFGWDLILHTCRFYQNPHLKGNYYSQTDSYCLVLIGDKKGWISSHYLGEVEK